uniref:Breast carcinoma-amplified sequence 3 homolog n=1 Tax=Diabrotica virgifera virgifera TaxID=50390 RepID=A0A6P7FVH4_DIAVI
MSESPVNTGPEPLSGPSKVLPRHVNDPTILESVAGFINEVVPTSHLDLHNINNQILWARFEEPETDKTAVVEVGSYASFIPSTLILILGYNTGIQVWAIPANGEATEILSWRHGYVNLLKFLPVPNIVGNTTKKDLYSSKRPLLAICDNSSSGPKFSSLNFVSLKTGEQVKVIKFKNSVIDVLANKQFVVVSFQEKIAIFDALTLEDHMTVTTCFLSPGLNPNPVTLGARWLAYAEKKLNMSKRSNGGMDGEGVQSYTATVIHAAKSLGRGLRGLGESVASSLTGNNTFKPGTSPNSPQAGGQSDVSHKGIVTILDIGCPSYNNLQENSTPSGDPVIAHFIAHTKPVVALQFDPSGMLLLTADKRGHDFHLFRIHPHPGGPQLTSVHHLYILHRGDTSAVVQDMCFSKDSRWACVSTLRGTTHVFPVTPYGGNVGMRTHATSHVVNKMSRFHRSAGLSVDGRSNSPISVIEMPSVSHYPYHNPRFPPYPHPTVVNPLAQIRQPIVLQNSGNTPPRQTTGRQRLPSASEENISLRLVTCFGAPRALIDMTRDSSIIKNTKPIDSLFVMSCLGTLIQYDLDPHQQSNIPKERVSSDTPIELTVTARAQWLLQRKTGGVDLVPPMTKENLNFVKQDKVEVKSNKPDYNDEHWLSQVEIITHAGPHRRLWMGPQFTFKTYKTIAGSPLSVGESQPIDLGHSKPINMPITKANAVLIESSSASSCEQHLLENYHRTLEEGGGVGELQLKEDLADAMLESPGLRDTGGRCVIVQMKPAVAKVVNPLGTVVNVHSDDEADIEVFEEAIHENCDETLFRPVVAPKPALHQDKVQYCENMLTKSLDSTTEVAVKILKKSTDKSEDKPVASYNKVTSVDAKSKEGKSESKRSKKVVTKVKVEPIFNLLDTKPLTPIVTEVEKVKPLISIEKLNTDFEQSNTSLLDFPTLDNDDFFSLENLPKVESFEDANEEPNTAFSDKKKSKLKVDRSSIEHVSENNSSEENAFEEKVAPKRNRKPKSKLGVKIVNNNNENTNADKNLENSSSDITLPAPPKKSWSNIAATKPKPKTIIDCTVDQFEDLPKIEFVEEEFTIQLPKRAPQAPPNISDFIDVNVSEEEKADTDTDKDVFSIPEDPFLSAGHKCSDDEKCDLSSSPTEATESDDSGKISNTTIFVETKVPTIAKSSKKKKKKK